MPSAFYIRLGRHIKQLREDRSWSQEYLAQQMQLHGHTTLIQVRQAEVEAGTKPVTLPMAISYARIFVINLGELVGMPDL